MIFANRKVMKKLLRQKHAEASGLSMEALIAIAILVAVLVIVFMVLKGKIGGLFQIR